MQVVNGFFFLYNWKQDYKFQVKMSVKKRFTEIEQTRWVLNDIDKWLYFFKCISNVTKFVFFNVYEMFNNKQKLSKDILILNFKCTETRGDWYYRPLLPLSMIEYSATVGVAVEWKKNTYYSLAKRETGKSERDHSSPRNVWFLFRDVTNPDFRDRTRIEIIQILTDSKSNIEPFNLNTEP